MSKKRVSRPQIKKPLNLELEIQPSKARHGAENNPSAEPEINPQDLAQRLEAARAWLADVRGEEALAGQSVLLSAEALLKLDRILNSPSD